MRSKPLRERPGLIQSALHDRSRPAAGFCVRTWPMEGDLPGFVIAGFALTGSPGPANLSLAAAGAAFGSRRSLALPVGITVGVVAVLLAAATGFSGLILAQPILGAVLRI